jgi:hypothetical protein
MPLLDAPVLDQALRTYGSAINCSATSGVVASNSNACSVGSASAPASSSSPASAALHANAVLIAKLARRSMKPSPTSHEHVVHVTACGWLPEFHLVAFRP